LAELQASLGRTAQRRFMDLQGAAFNRDGAQDWAFGVLPMQIKTAAGVPAWPALVDQGDAVGLRVFDTWDEAVFSHRAGVMRLLALRLADKAKFLRTHHGLERNALLAWSTVGGAEALVADLFWRSLADTLAEAPASVPGQPVHELRDPAAFGQLLERVRSRIGLTCVARAAELKVCLPLYGKVSGIVRGSPVRGAWAKRHPEAFNDLDSQLHDLVYPGFLAELECGRLGHYPRYLKAVEERLDQLERNPLRDRQRQQEVEPWWRRYLDALVAGAAYDEAIDAYRWLLHEFRVSVFAQRLGTAEKVSPKRLAEAWEATNLGSD
jgi:ATP-dependent helicase HrpA